MLLLPASPGTGVIAGGPVRAVLEAAGVHDVLTKTLGTSNPINVVRATMQALLELRDPRRAARAARPERVIMAGSREGRIAVRWMKSQIGYDRRQRATLRGLGLRRLNQRVELEDTPVGARDDRQGAAPRRGGGSLMLDALSPRPGSRTRRPGASAAGPGTRHNKTTGRGIKGQGKRSAGRETPFYFEGGQMPLVRRLPKRGFRSLFGTELPDRQRRRARPYFGDGASRRPAGARAARPDPRTARVGVKLLAEGDAAAQPARSRCTRPAPPRAQKIEAAGGSVELIA